MRIQNNIMAMNTHRQLGINNLNQTKSTEKLASGYRINRAADDAAGLMISEKMRSQIRGLNQASANAQDGISLIQAAEGALQETHSILQRMRELAVKAGNDVNELEDRGAIKAEMDQLTKEVDRIAFTTEFNKKTLLDGSLQNGFKSAKVLSGSGVATGIVVDQKATPGMANIEVAAGLKEKGVYDIKLDKSVEGEIVSIKIGATIANPIDATAASLLSAGTVVTFVATGNVEADNATAVNMLKEVLDKTLGDYYTVSSSGNSLIIEANQVGTKYTAGSGISFSTSAIKADGSTGGSSGFAAAITKNTTASITGKDATVKVNGGVALTMSTTRYGEYTDTTSGLTFRIEDLTRDSASVVRTTSGTSLTLQVGANTSVDQTIGIAVRSLSAASLGIDNLSVHNNEAARTSIYALDLAIAGVSEQRSALGAVQNRLEHTVANLDTVSENLQSAESRIRDVDMAKEMMNFTKNNILQQAATAMLAQANQAPQTVLQLLR